MGRENKKEAVAALHRAQILAAAQELFRTKGFAQTSIDDISKASAYSRRTLYAYYENKEDILHHILLQGLISLKNDLTEAVKQGDFYTVCRAVCAAMTTYYRRYPCSMQTVMHTPTAQKRPAAAPDTEDRAAGAAESAASPAVQQIFRLGEEIHALLAAWIRRGQEEGAVSREQDPDLTVYILSAEMTAFLELCETKGSYIRSSLDLSEEAMREYGFRQILYGIAKEPAGCRESRCER